MISNEALATHSDETIGYTYDTFLSAVHNYQTTHDPTVKEIFRDEIEEAAQELAAKVLPKDTCATLEIDVHIIDQTTSRHQPTEIDVAILAKATQITEADNLEKALYATIDHLPEKEMSDRIKQAIERAAADNQPITEAIINTIDSEIKRTTEPFVYLHMATRAIDAAVNYNTLPINDEHLERLIHPDELVQAKWENNRRTEDGSVRPIVADADDMPVVVFSDTDRIDPRTY